MVSKLELPQLQSCSSHRAELLCLGRESQPQLCSAHISSILYTHDILNHLLRWSLSTFSDFLVDCRERRARSGRPAGQPQSPAGLALLEGSAHAKCRRPLPPGGARPAVPTRASCGSQGLPQQGPVCSGALAAGVSSSRAV